MARQGSSGAFGEGFQAAKRRPRTPLHRDRVVEGAVAILDRAGPDALTFRRLAADLDVGAATLYWHVANKEVLLQLALEHVGAELSGSFGAAGSQQPWETRLRDGLTDLWQLLLRHPWAAGLAMASVDRGPNFLGYWDRGATLLLEAGFDETRTFIGLTTLFTFTIGSGMVNAIWHTYGADNETVRRETLAQAAAFFAGLDREAFPSFQRLTPVLAAHDETEQFLAGLELQIAGLRAQAD